MPASRDEPTVSEQRYACELEAVTESRHDAVERLGACGLPQLSGDAALILTELASNAIRHAGSPFTVRLSCWSSWARLEVSDASGVMPVARHTGLTEAGGRGLRIVAALATAWGSEPVPSGGKVVWAEVGRRP